MSLGQKVPAYDRDDVRSKMLRHSDNVKLIKNLADKIGAKKYTRDKLLIRNDYGSKELVRRLDSEIFELNEEFNATIQEQQQLVVFLNAAGINI